MTDETGGVGAAPWRVTSNGVRSGLVVALTLALTLGVALGLARGQWARADRPLVERRLVLPHPHLAGKMSLQEALSKRRSERVMSDEGLDDATIGQLLWAAQGITLPSRGFRTAPSAGARYPLRIYLLTAQGLFRYQPKGHLLHQIDSTDLRAALWAGVYGRPWLARAPAMFLIAADIRATAAKYGVKARRFVHMEAGHAAQNLLLQSTALELHAVGVGAFDPVDTRRTLRLPTEQELLYVLVVGKPPRTSRVLTTP